MQFGRGLGASLILALSIVACGDDDMTSTAGAGGGGDGGSDTTAGPTGSGGAITTTGTGGAEPSGLAPAGTLPGEEPASDGDNLLSTPAGEDAVLRVDVEPNQHVGFFLDFEPGIGGVVLELSRWDGQAPQVLAFTDGGSGLRTLAAFDANGPRTFWVRVSADDAFDGTLKVVRTPFEDAAQCTGDCDRLLQLPVPNDPIADGYDWTPSTVFRYQFGRRDLVMLLRFAGQQMALAGRTPIIPEDLSQWNGLTPGTDVGAPRHASHQNGKDVDISLYGTDGQSVWRSYCDAVTTANGRECTAGSATGLDGRANAEMYGAFLQSQRVTMSFLDQELIPFVQDGADEAVGADTLDATLLPLYSDGTHLQHWPNHDNHIHVRLSEGAYGAVNAAAEPFEAP